jgi:hypothetical protein
MDLPIWDPITGLLQGPVTLFIGLSCPQYLRLHGFGTRSGIHALIDIIEHASKSVEMLYALSQAYKMSPKVR